MRARGEGAEKSVALPRGSSHCGSGGGAISSDGASRRRRLLLGRRSRRVVDRVTLAALPNILTLLRLAIAPLLPAAYWLAPRPAVDWIALALFAIAMATDFLDGWLARRYRLESDFGRMLDPIADKAAVLAALFLWAALWQIDRPGAPLEPLVFGAALLILLRELIVSGLREHLGGAELRVSKLAKVKTALQAVALGALLLDQALRAARQADCADALCRLAAADGDVTRPALTLLWGAVGLTLWTGADYARAAWAAKRAERPTEKTR